MRAAYDTGQGRRPRLRAAAELAAAHGSVALLRRCERDLASADARRARAFAHERCAERAPRTLGERRWPSVGTDQQRTREGAP